MYFEGLRGQGPWFLDPWTRSGTLTNSIARFANLAFRYMLRGLENFLVEILETLELLTSLETSSSDWLNNSTR